VFVGVYAAFWLNNYQQHRQDAERRDQILASLEQEFLRGIERAPELGGLSFLFRAGNLSALDSSEEFLLE